MKNKIDEFVYTIIQCPNCQDKLELTASGFECHHCRTSYLFNTSGIPDLRLKGNKKVRLEFNVGQYEFPDINLFGKLKVNSEPEIDLKLFSNLPVRLSKEIVSYFPDGKGKGVMLDLGCGNQTHRKICEDAGFKYVGIDYANEKAQILADGHALPFKNESFDFILSIAVLTHIRYPFVMLGEVIRVLKPGGKFIGTVAFLEPYNGYSYYHHSHIGTYNSLSHAGFTIEKVGTNGNWSVLKAFAVMRLLPGLPRFIPLLLMWPVNFIHKLWWKFVFLMTHDERLSEKNRILLSAASFTFICRKQN